MSPARRVMADGVPMAWRSSAGAVMMPRGSMTRAVMRMVPVVVMCTMEMNRRWARRTHMHRRRTRHAHRESEIHAEVNTSLGFSRKHHDQGHAGEQQESGKILFHDETGERGLHLQQTERFKSPVLFMSSQKNHFLRRNRLTTG